MLMRTLIVLATTAAVVTNLFAGLPLFMDPSSFSAEAAELQGTKRLHQKSPEEYKHAEAKSQQALTEQLVSAIEEENIVKVEALLAKDADVNRHDTEGELPLEKAARKGSMALVRLLWRSGADPNFSNRNGQKALKAAFIEAVSNCHEDVARYFLDIGVNVNTVSPKKGTVLQRAAGCIRELVELLIKKGADVNGKGDAEIVLTDAARLGNVETIRLLTDKGADVNAKNDRGETALMVAAYWGGVEITRFPLDNGADVNARNDKGETALVGVASGLGLFQENPTNRNVPLRNQLRW